MANERSGFPELMKKTGYKYFFEEYDRHETVHDKIFAMENSTGAWEQDTTALMAGELKEKKILILLVMGVMEPEL